MGLSETAKKFAPVAATPVLKAILEQVDALHLRPLAHWEWDETAVSVITYFVAATGAATGCIWTVRSRRTRTILLAIGVIVLVACFCGYSWVSKTPPRADNERLFDAIGYTTFFVTQIAFGFVVSRIAKTFG